MSSEVLKRIRAEQAAKPTVENPPTPHTADTEPPPELVDLPALDDVPPETCQT